MGERHGNFVLPVNSGCAGASGISGHAQIVKDQANIALQLAHFLCDASLAVQKIFDNADGKPA